MRRCACSGTRSEGKSERRDVAPLLECSRQDDRSHVGVGSEHVGGGRRRAGCRDGGRGTPPAACGRPRESRSRSSPERVEHRLVGREPGEVVLLLQPRKPPHLRRGRPEPVEPVLGNRIRNDDATRCPAAERVLRARELVVEGVRGGNPERAGDERELVRCVRERDVEAPRCSPSRAALGGAR